MAAEHFDKSRAASAVETLALALRYRSNGYRPIWTPLGEKGPKYKNWQHSNYTEEQLRRIFGSKQSNIGLLLGEPSNWLTDIDLDCPEACELAPVFLPPTAMVTGRESKPCSHFFYRCEGSETVKHQYCKEMLVEIRSTGAQTIMPPSLHPSGERYAFSEDSQPARVDRADLERRVALLAATVALKRSWPAEGTRTRHQVALALAGMLLAGGVSKDDAILVIRHAAKLAGDDEVEDRVKAVESTAKQREAGEPFTGERKVRELLGEVATDSIRALLGLRIEQGQDADQGKVTQSVQIVELVGSADLFHSPAKEPFVTVKVGNHLETMPINSAAFRGILTNEFYKRSKKIPQQSALTDAIGLLSSRAIIEGRVEQLFIRVARVGDKIFLDLCDDSWEIVKITTDGWSIEADRSVKLRRPSGMLALPRPERGGNFQDLRGLLNPGIGDGFVLVACSLLGMLRGVGPFPLLAISGEQGGAKSTLTRVIRLTIDPNVAPLRSQPRDLRDLIIAANNSWVVCFDNLSRLPEWLSDGLCRISTGGGLGARKLYSDQDETLLDVQRPAIFNGIEELATRPDLLDRSIVIHLPAIPNELRRPEAIILQDFEVLRPKLLGCLLDAASQALGKYREIKLDSLPRMSDFAIWGVAGETALGFAAGTFLPAYEDNRLMADQLALDASGVAQAILSFMKDKNEWQGTATELLNKLELDCSDQFRCAKKWPGDPRALSQELARIAPNLRRIGIYFDWGKPHRNARIIYIVKKTVS